METSRPSINAPIDLLRLSGGDTGDVGVNQRLGSRIIEDGHGRFLWHLLLSVLFALVLLLGDLLGTYV